MKRRASHSIIGLNGYGFVGKDTVATIIKEEFGGESRAFADLVRTVAETINYPIQLRDGKAEKECYKTILRRMDYGDAKRDVYGFRPYLVGIGEGLRNSIDKDVWIDSVLPTTTHLVKTKYHFYPEQPLVLSDARYVNECNRIKSLGGIVVRINRPGVGPADATEAVNVAAVTPDIVIDNNDTMDDLRAKVIYALAG